MIINKEQLYSLIQEEVHKQEAKQLLQSKIKQLEEEISELDNTSALLREFQGAPMDASMIAAPPQQQQPVVQQSVAPAPADETESESIFDTRPGETVIFNFQDVTIKVQRQLDDLFKVVDARESKKLKDGDLIHIQGNDILKRGRKFTFDIYRIAGVRYESNPLVSWKVIKNK